MNVYVVIEGERGCKKIYREWIPQVNQNLIYIDYIHQFYQNNFLIMLGRGQSNIWGIIEKAIEDVNSILHIDRLVIGMDSEETNPQDKLSELKDYINKLRCRVEVRYIIQNFCLETWLLGNKQAIRKNPQDAELLKYMSIFNVRVSDPELLPLNKGIGNTRAQFAYKYIHAGIRDKYSKRCTYSKNNPGPVSKSGYFHELKHRFSEDRHILSFSGFLNAFS